MFVELLKYNINDDLIYNQIFFEYSKPQEQIIIEEKELLQPLNTFNHEIGQFVNMNLLYFCYFGYYTASFFFN